MSFPVLWLYGPSGVGKTTTGMSVYTRLSADGVPVARADLDQLNLMYPTPRWMRPLHLAGVVEVFRAAGAECLVVSGIGEDTDVIRECAAALHSQARLTVARLRLEREALRERFLGRNWILDRLDDTLRDAEAYDEEGFGDVVVDASGTVDEVAAEAVKGWPARTGGPMAGVVVPPAPGASGSDVDLPVTWFTKAGPELAPGGWTLFERVREKEPAGYADLTQLGHCSRGDRGWVIRRNLEVLKSGFARAGAARMVVAGTKEEIASVGGGQ